MCPSTVGGGAMMHPDFCSWSTLWHHWGCSPGLPLGCLEASLGEGCPADALTPLPAPFHRKTISSLWRPGSTCFRASPTCRAKARRKLGHPTWVPGGPQVKGLKGHFLPSPEREMLEAAGHQQMGLARPREEHLGCYYVPVLCSSLHGKWSAQHDGRPRLLPHSRPGSG